MLTAKHVVTREEVIRFYAAYDRCKKEKQLPSDIDEWPWDDPDGIDLRLCNEHLKRGVLAAYRIWRLVVFDIADLLRCAISNGIFPGESQALCQLVLRGKVAEWQPDRDAEWWPLIKNGAEIDVAQALVARPSVAFDFLTGVMRPPLCIGISPKPRSRPGRKQINGCVRIDMHPKYGTPVRSMPL
jgi:hypothetical protein